MKKVFYWDWKENAPIGEIFKSYRKGSKLFSVDRGMSDTNVLVIAKNKKEALKIYLKNCKWEFSKEDYKYILEDVNLIDIQPWED